MLSSTLPTNPVLPRMNTLRPRKISATGNVGPGGGAVPVVPVDDRTGSLAAAGCGFSCFATTGLNNVPGPEKPTAPARRLSRDCPSVGLQVMVNNVTSGAA
jgi:hypothetical protein